MVGCWLAWHVGRAEILFPDGLRYVAQARAFDQGAWTDGLKHAVDHPLYPLIITATHRVLNADNGPIGWQFAAQVAAATAGTLLVLPLYLVARERFGKASAWLGCMLVFLVPLPAHVFADVLSESTFLLCWLWGVWTALRFLRQGEARWLILSLGFGGLTYLSRPEGLLLFGALLLTLGLTVLVPSARFSSNCWWRSMAILVVGPILLVGPFIATKGGIGTKPAVARLLGLSGPSRPDAVERERPLRAKINTVEVARMSAAAAVMAIGGAVTFPLIPFAVIGIVAAVRRTHREQMRGWLFLGIVVATATLAFVRLYATGGYCTPRHTLVIALLLIVSAGAGIRSVIARVVRSPRAYWMRPVLRSTPIMTILGLIMINGPALIAPVNFGAGSYREAASWVVRNVPIQGRIIDVTGWAQFYSQHSGYTFANLIEAPADPTARWVIVRDAHLWGPWPYCEQLRSLITGAELVARFPANRQPGRSRVSIYERPDTIANRLPGPSRR